MTSGFTCMRTRKLSDANLSSRWSATVTTTILLRWRGMRHAMGCRRSTALRGISLWLRQQLEMKFGDHFGGQIQRLASDADSGGNVNLAKQSHESGFEGGLHRATLHKGGLQT